MKPEEQKNQKKDEQKKEIEPHTQTDHKHKDAFDGQSKKDGDCG